MPLITHGGVREMIAVIKFSPKMPALQNRNAFGLSGEVIFLQMLMNMTFENCIYVNPAFKYLHYLVLKFSNPTCRVTTWQLHLQKEQNRLANTSYLFCLPNIWAFSTKCLKFG